MFEPALYKAEYKYTGIRQYINYPMPQPLYERSSRTYPTYNIPYRTSSGYNSSSKEFDEKWITARILCRN